MLYRIPLTVTDQEKPLQKTDQERLARLHFHLKSGDYFPTLATILGFVEETISSLELPQDAMPALERELIHGVRKDLMYLHKYYQIELKVNER
jgi:formate dehydrogenase maturation protein FdhE